MEPTTDIVLNLLSTLITGLPNLAVAIYVIYWQQRKLDELLKFQMDIINQLSELCKPCQDDGDDAPRLPSRT